jgi:hypothetical protein
MIRNQQQGTKQMLGIGLVALMISLGPICQYVLETHFPVPPFPIDDPEPAPYFGPSRRVYEIANALA